MMTHSDYKVGMRVMIHPGTDLFMRGARYARITSMRRNGIIYVVPEVAGRELRMRVKMSCFGFMGVAE